MQRTREHPIQIRVTESEKRRLQRNARACIKCGQCEEMCPQRLPIRQYLEDVAKAFE